MINLIEARLTEIAAIKDGWLDGLGVAIDKSAIEWCRTHASDFVNMSDGGVPYFYPTPEGGIQVEIDMDPITVTINIDKL